VLDVGCGGGAAGLALVPPAGRVVGFDQSADLLDAFSTRANELGVDFDELQGNWPDDHAKAPVADVVVCHHVAYNVPGLAAFAEALSTHAGRRVVMELKRPAPAGRPELPVAPLLGPRPSVRADRGRRGRGAGRGRHPAEVERSPRTSWWARADGGAGGVRPPLPVPPGRARSRDRRGHGRPARAGPAGRDCHPLLGGRGLSLSRLAPDRAPVVVKSAVRARITTTGARDGSYRAAPAACSRSSRGAETSGAATMTEWATGGPPSSPEATAPASVAISSPAATSHGWPPYSK